MTTPSNPAQRPSPGTAPLQQQPQYVVEGIILRRLYEKRIEGYTIETAKEIVEALSGIAHTPADPAQCSLTQEQIARALAGVSWVRGGNEHAKTEFIERRWPNYTMEADAILALSSTFHDAAYTAKEPRFFIDHGMIHDRQTGKHVTTEADSAFNDGILRCCELLNALAEQREPKPFPLLFDSNWLEDKIKTDPDIDCEVGPSLSSTHSQGTP
jgi:hypothetical protein